MLKRLLWMPPFPLWAIQDHEHKVTELNDMRSTAEKDLNNEIQSANEAL